ncbi:ATP-binding protein [Candidatus Woesearchaeota archaeon]|nr:ATP-binding protein [Candidatus Woesearchaeota archaeon]
MRLHVITGGPGVGKTTLLQELEKIGYPILPEVARDIIEEGKYHPSKDYKKFGKEVVRRQKALERTVNGVTTFCDRSLVDAIAYKRIYNLDVDLSRILEARNRYSRVFLLDSLPNYQKDDVRFESPEFAKRIHQEIERTYISLGYNPIILPPVSVDERVSLILREIEST